jgi:hypothetical protein
VLRRPPRAPLAALRSLRCAWSLFLLLALALALIFLGGMQRALSGLAA